MKRSLIVLELLKIQKLLYLKRWICWIFGLSKKLWHKYVEVERKYKTDTDKMTASDYTHLFGYLNPYYRTAYSIPKRKR